MTTEITIFENNNVATITQLAPQAYNENKLSHDRCLQFGNALLERAKTEGMSDTLDQEIAHFIEKSKKTLKKMNERRSAVTQLFDTIRTAYTGLENEVDPTKKNTIPSQLQYLRNKYAAKKREEQEAELRRRQLEQALINAKAQYATEVENDYTRQFNALIASTCNRIIELDKSLTLDNYAIVADGLKNTSDKLPQEWIEALRPEVLLPAILSPADARIIATEVKQKMQERLVEQFSFEISTNRDEALDRLPSKRKELERIAAANAEEAARIKKEMEERERKEAELRAKEKAEREAQEKAAAELAAQKQEMDGLFGAAQAQVQEYQLKTQVKKQIKVLDIEGFMPIVGMWWSQHGCTLTIEELTKIFSKQLTFCNKLANDKEHPMFIQSDKIEYVEDIKAK